MRLRSVVVLARLGVFFLLLVAVHTEAYALASSARKKDGLHFDQQVKDFGVVYRGMKLTQPFLFQNRGPDPIAIRGVYTTCGCTTTDLDKDKHYSVGESGTIGVTFDTANYRGKVTKEVMVLADGKDDLSVSLTLKADIVEEVSAEPPILDFGEASLANRPTKEILIYAKDLAAPLEVRNIRYDKDLFEINTEKSGNDYLLKVRLKDSVQTGFLKDTIVVENNSRYLAELPLPVRAHVLGNITHKPDYIEFGAITKNKDAKRIVKMVGLDPFAITDVQAEMNINGQMVEDAEDYLVIEPTAEKGAGAGTVHVALKNAGLSGSVHGKLLIATSNPVQKAVEVKFYAVFKE